MKSTWDTEEPAHHWSMSFERPTCGSDLPGNSPVLLIGKIWIHPDCSGGNSGKAVSGGVSVSAVALHVACDDRPFGGAGHSGMGNCRGHEGLRTFSVEAG